jgi:hypothetical protein
MHPARLTKSVVGLINGRRKAAAIAMAAGIRAAMPIMSLTERQHGRQRSRLAQLTALNQPEFDTA